MNDGRQSEEARRTRRRWIGFGEIIAVIAVVISALGLWKSWDSGDKPTTVVEERRAIPLTLRGQAEDDGRTLRISPAEDSHALQSLRVSIAGTNKAIDVGSDGALSAADVEQALPDDKNLRKGTQRVRARIEARYVEAGADKRSGGTYVIAYRWEGGGLFGGHSLRLASISRT